MYQLILIRNPNIIKIKQKVPPLYFKLTSISSDYCYINIYTLTAKIEHLSKYAALFTYS